MGILTFVAEMTKSLAWPTSAILAIWMLRDSIRNLIPNIRKLKYKDLEADFSKDLQRAEVEARQASLPSAEEAHGVEVGTPEPAAERYRRLAEVSPRAAIIEAWRDVEIELTAAATFFDFDDPQDDRHPNLSTVMSRLTREGFLDRAEEHFIEYMRLLRNEAVHRDVDMGAIRDGLPIKRFSGIRALIGFALSRMQTPRIRYLSVRANPSRPD